MSQSPSRDKRLARLLVPAVCLLILLGAGASVWAQEAPAVPKIKVVLKTAGKDADLAKPGQPGPLSVDVEFEVPLQTLAQFPEEIRKYLEQWRKQGKHDAQEFHKEMQRVVKKWALPLRPAKTSTANRDGTRLAATRQRSVERVNLRALELPLHRQEQPHEQRREEQP